MYSPAPGFRNPPAEITVRNLDMVERSRAQRKPWVARRQIVLDLHASSGGRRAHGNRVRETVGDVRQLGIAGQVLFALPAQDGTRRGVYSDPSACRFPGWPARAPSAVSRSADRTTQPIVRPPAESGPPPESHRPLASHRRAEAHPKRGERRGQIRLHLRRGLISPVRVLLKRPRNDGLDVGRQSGRISRSGGGSSCTTACIT